MIYKIIATFPCGNKIIRSRPYWSIRYFHNLKVNRKRPNLIQVFGKNFTKYDIREIYGDLKKTLNPKIGILTVNGNYLSVEKIECRKN